MNMTALLQRQEGSAGLWRGVVLLLSILLLLALYYETAWSMVSIWYRSETFAHGFLIVPIVAWLVWRRRERLAAIEPVTNWWSVPLLLLCGFGWLLGNVADVLVVQQFSFVAMVPLLVLLVMGSRFSMAIAFPLAFLFFAVPVGEGLIEPLMNFTASFTVGAIRLSGIPVYWQGTHFSIPGSNWSVVEACSGVRYLIASVTMGSLYAYLTYTSYWRRSVFVLAAIVAPIIANGLRAYMIVMIAHFSDMTLALGVDHLIYGWVFFGIVIFLLFMVGAIWSQEERPEQDGSPVAPREADAQVGSVRAGIVAVCLIMIWPLWAQYIRAAELENPGSGALARMASSPSWSEAESQPEIWTPTYLGASDEQLQRFEQNGHGVSLYLALYPGAGEDAELVSSSNVLIPQKHPVWRQTEVRELDKRIGDMRFTVRQARLESAERKLLVLRWHWLAGTHTANDYVAKAVEAWVRLRGGDGRAVGIVVFTDYEQAGDGAEQRLDRFLTDSWEALDEVLVGR